MSLRFRFGNFTFGRTGLRFSRWRKSWGISTPLDGSGGNTFGIIRAGPFRWFFSKRLHKKQSGEEPNRPSGCGCGCLVVLLVLLVGGALGHFFGGGGEGQDAGPRQEIERRVAVRKRELLQQVEAKIEQEHKHLEDEAWKRWRKAANEVTTCPAPWEYGIPPEEKAHRTKFREQLLQQKLAAGKALNEGAFTKELEDLRSRLLKAVNDKIGAYRAELESKLVPEKDDHVGP